MRNWQLITAVAMVAAGLAFLAVALFIPPEGEIHPSVLVACGELLTFAGALFGIDYSYKKKG